MLVKNALKLLSKFGEVTHKRINRRGLKCEFSAYVAPELQIRIGAADKSETTECGYIRAFHAPSGIFQSERSLKKAIQWCLDLKYPDFRLDGLCDLPITLTAGINHNSEYQEQCHLIANASVSRWGPNVSSSYTSSSHEPVAIVHGILEDNFCENVLAEFLLENSPEFENVWKTANRRKVDESYSNTSIHFKLPNKVQFSLLSKKLRGTRLDFDEVLNSMFGSEFCFPDLDYEELMSMLGLHQCYDCLKWEEFDDSRRDEEGFLCKWHFSQLKWD